jgi:hypothetical protein
MLFKKKKAVHSENNMEAINMVCWKSGEILMLTQVVHIVTSLI